MTNVEIPNGLPILSTGTHDRESGKACIMNAISYLNGDKNITDYPGCVHPLLAKMAQFTNDSICTHVTDDFGTLCGSCSHKIWLLGARVMGTGRGEMLARLDGDELALLSKERAWVHQVANWVTVTFGKRVSIRNGIDSRIESSVNVIFSRAMAIARTEIIVNQAQGPLWGSRDNVNTLILKLDYEIIRLFEATMPPPIIDKVTRWTDEDYKTVVTGAKVPVYTG